MDPKQKMGSKKKKKKKNHTHTHTYKQLEKGFSALVFDRNYTRHLSDGSGYGSIQ